MTKLSRAAISIGLMWAVSVTLSYSQAPPLPPKRPPDLGPESRKGAAPGAFPKEHPRAPPDNGQQIQQSGIEECVTRLSALGVNVQAENSPHDNVAMPIRIKHVTGRYGLGSGIQFPNQPLIDCRLAEPLARWLGEVVAPIFAANFSSPLTAVRTGPGYECRNRNHEETGKISAHAIGLALEYSAANWPTGKSCQSDPKAIQFRKRFHELFALPVAVGSRRSWDLDPTRRTPITYMSMYCSTDLITDTESVNSLTETAAEEPLGSTWMT